ncbi:MAG: WG repeat-containing protein [Rikenellaceae bacterium]
MAATINNFISALYSPAEHFDTLASIVAQRDQMGRVVVSRTKHFADALIEWQGRSYLLSLPLSSSALSMAQHASVALRRLRSKVLLEYRLLPNELRYIDAQGRFSTSALLLEELPRRVDIASLSGGALYRAISHLEGEFCRLQLTHSNLRLDNIVVGEDHLLYPLRMHYASVGSVSSAEFDLLRDEVARELKRQGSADALSEFEMSASLREAEAKVEAENTLYGYLSVGNPFEGMCVAESEAGYGYIGLSGEEIIPPQFIWAGDMREGRAEVETPEGMGLMDAHGNFVIEPRYRIVEFDVATGTTRAKLGEEWLLFDYEGRLLSAEDVETAQEARATL